MVGEAQQVNCNPPLPADAMANYEDENGVDDDKALSNAISALKNKKFAYDDLDFYFTQIEIVMQTHGVKKNYTKFMVLASIIPTEVENEVKPLLRKKETELNNEGYKLLKNKILQIFSAKQEARYLRAMGRTLTGKPSQLARALVDDICDHELEGCCCPHIVLGMWKQKLPLAVRQGIARMRFSKETFDEICQVADDVFGESPSSGVMAAVSVNPAGPTPAWTAADNNWQPALDPNQAYYQLPEVAAIRSPWRGGRGGRGGRNFRFQSRGNRGGGQSAQSGGGASASNSDPKPGVNPRDARLRWPRATRSGDSPPIQSCKKHWVFGKNAHNCEEPAYCPWKDYFTPRQQ